VMIIPLLVAMQIFATWGEAAGARK
jgi:hypothetical protein